MRHKNTLRDQICSLENVTRLLKHELEKIALDKNRVTLISEAEDELINKKRQEEKKAKKIVQEDLTQ